MECKFNKVVTDGTQFDYEVKIPKYILARLVDYFVFNSDGKVHFDATGRMEGIESVPVEVVDLVKTILDVQMCKRDWEDLLLATRWRGGNELLERILEERLERL